MSEEIKNVAEELQNEAPVVKETKKAVLNAVNRALDERGIRQSVNIKLKT